jgi:MFS family permease
MLSESAPVPEPGPWRRFVAGFPALRHRNFRLFIVGQGTSLVGFWMQSVAQGWLVYRLQERPLDVGKVAFAGYLPILFLSPVAGVIADRLPRRPVLLVTQTLLMLLALGLGVLVWYHAVTVPILMAFAAGVGLVSALDVPTRQSFLVEMVGPEDLTNAIALNSSIFNGARVVGPAIAGSLIGVVGEAACFFLNAASYLAVLAALARMRVGARRARTRSSRCSPASARPPLRLGRARPAEPAPPPRDRLRDGVQYQVLMPVFARTVLPPGRKGSAFS